MAKIDTYSKDNNLDSRDKVLGSSYVSTLNGRDVFTTSSYTLGDLGNYFSGYIEQNGSTFDLNEIDSRITALEGETEADTLSTVVARGNETSLSISANGFFSKYPSSPTNDVLFGKSEYGAAVGVGGSLNFKSVGPWSGSNLGTKYELKTCSSNSTSLTNRHVITNYGYTKITSTGSLYNETYNTHELVASNGSGDPVIRIVNSGAGNPSGVQVIFSGASPDNNYNFFFRGSDTTSAKFAVYSDGNVWTSDAGTLSSDENIKENIVDATPKLNDLMSLRVRNFNWKEEYHPNSKDKKLIGFIAQEVEQVFPGLVSSHIIVDKTETQEEVVIKGIKESKLIPIMVKAMQEQQAIINDLISRIQILENS